MENLEHRLTQSDYAQFTNDDASLINNKNATANQLPRKSRTLFLSILVVLFLFSSLILFVIFIKSENHSPKMAELTTDKNYRSVRYVDILKNWLNYSEKMGSYFGILNQLDLKHQ